MGQCVGPICRSLIAMATLGVALTWSVIAVVRGQELAPPLTTDPAVPGPAPVPLPLPAPTASDRPLPINLPTALRLANANPIDVAVASERIRLATAELDRAKVLWLPTLQLGVDYQRPMTVAPRTPRERNFRHEQEFVHGRGRPRRAFFSFSDALFEPLAARQGLRARRAELETARNDSTLAVAETSLAHRAAGRELAGAEDAVRRATELVRRAEKLAQGLVPPAEAVRARAELARRLQVTASTRERWRTASAELLRILRLDGAALVEPMEPPHLRVSLLRLDVALDELITRALTNRPELATHQALVQATLHRLRQEQLRPLVPSLLLRGAATNPDTMAAGVYGGGLNSSVNNFGARADFDVELLWQLENLGFGNRAKVDARRSEQRLAQLELFRTQDRIAAEVATAFDQAQSADTRLAEAEIELRSAVDSVEKNFEGLEQTKRAGNVILLVIRPQEAVAAVQALAQAYVDYYATVGDYNRAQFRLYRALGQPTAAVLPGADPACQPVLLPQTTPGPPQLAAPAAVLGTPESR